MVNWYHTYLLHPGMDRTEATISHHLFWTKLREHICTQMKVRKACHRNKKRGLKCGYLTAN